MLKYHKVVRLAIVSSHPIQYNAPLFRLLSTFDGLDVKVFYSWRGATEKNDREFGKKITWDIPLLTGYDYCFNHNIAKDPGTHHFFGLNNPGLIGEIERWGANCVLVYGWAFKTHLAVLRHFHGQIPVFFRGDSTLLTGSNQISRLLKKPSLLSKTSVLKKTLRSIWLRWVYSHIDVAFYPGQCSKKYFMNFGVPLSNLMHVPHSIDNDRFSRDSIKLEYEASKRRGELGIPDDALVLLFAGKLVPHKQPLFLLKAIQDLVGFKGLNIHLIFIGSGSSVGKLVDSAEGCSYVHFLGFKNQSEMPLTYRLGDVYVLPSISETWGLGVNEALSCSRPVVVSDRVGCGDDLVKAGVSGDVFPVEDVERFKQIIIGYYENRDKTLSMRKTSFSLISEWSIEKSADSIDRNIRITIQRFGLLET